MLLRRCPSFWRQKAAITSWGKRWCGSPPTARLAQSVEHETLNLRVVGSSPTLGDQSFSQCHFKSRLSLVQKLFLNIFSFSQVFRSKHVVAVSRVCSTKWSQKSCAQIDGSFLKIKSDLDFLSGQPLQKSALQKGVFSFMHHSCFAVVYNVILADKDDWAYSTQQRHRYKTIGSRFVLSAVTVSTHTICASKFAYSYSHIPFKLSAAAFSHTIAASSAATQKQQQSCTAVADLWGTHSIDAGLTQWKKEKGWCVLCLLLRIRL